MTCAPVNIDTAKQQTAALEEERNHHLPIISHLLWCLLSFKIKLLKRSINLHLPCTNKHMMRGGDLVWSSGSGQNVTTKQLDQPRSPYEAQHRCRVSSVTRHYRSGRICTSITHVKWRINRHFGIGRISVVGVKAEMYSSVGSLPRTHQSGEMMSCDSNYVKKVDTCKGAANWNQYTSPFITNRQLINEARALQVLLNSLPGWTAAGPLHYSKSTA